MMKYHEDLTTTQARRNIIKKKKLLRSVYEEWYKLLLADIKVNSTNPIIELGTGAGFIKELYPNIICSDILPLSYIDLVCNCLCLPLKNESVKRFIMINVFHHVTNPRRFLQELERCLMLSGQVVMIEPANTLWGRFIWKNFHHENFLPRATDWKIDEDTPLSCANGAMPWIVFSRDRELFLQEFPSLEIEQYYTHSSFSYLLSGGFSYPQLIPSILIGPLFRLDALACRVSGQLGMFSVIKLRKKVS